ncbi:MAG: hypothetical protein WCI73_20980 [Phycisphaerae bacterium]
MNDKHDSGDAYDFEALYATFRRDEELAKGIKSPNTQDTLVIKAAIVGFSYTVPTETWGIDEYDYVTNALSEIGGLSERELLFYALALGYLLGLVHAAKIGPSVFRVALAQLPGFILLKGGRF